MKQYQQAFINKMEQNKRRNIVFLSSTGNGKSSTCNSIVEENFFATSDEMNSCTSAAADKIIEKHNLRIIDTAGFGDTRFDERVIDKILTDLTARLTDLDGSGTNQIDAFVLVCKCTPRATSLKHDIEHMRNIFGTVSLKSTVLLIINTGKSYEDSDQKVFETIRDEMVQIVKILSEAKEEPFNEKWFVRWDNIKPRPNQMQNLLKSIEGFEGYTHEKFLAAQKEINDRLDKVVNQKIEEEKKQIEKDYKNNIKKIEEKTQAMKNKYEAERIEMKKSAEAAALNSQKMIVLFKEMNDKRNAQLKDVLKTVQDQSQAQLKGLMDQIDKNNQNYQKRFQQMNQKANQGMTMMMDKIREIMSRPVTVQQKRSGLLGMGGFLGFL